MKDLLKHRIRHCCLNIAEAAPGELGPILGPPVQERPGHTGESCMEGR